MPAASTRTRGIAGRGCRPDNVTGTTGGGPAPFDSKLSANRGFGDGRENGMHALRHHYASMPMRGGVDVKRVGAYLRQQSAAFTLNGYSHLMPDDEEPVTPQPRRAGAVRSLLRCDPK
jgi:hypothetical protein